MNMLASYDRATGAPPEALEQDAAAWALRITTRWRTSIESIIETGQLLIDSKLSLEHGQFEAMIEVQLPFSSSTARRLMAIASDKRISDRAHVNVLPASWGTLYELTKLSDEEFEGAIEKKIIRPDMERAEVALLRPSQSESNQRQTASPDTMPAPGVASRPDDGRSSSATSEIMDATAGETAPYLPNGTRAIMGSRHEPDDSLDYFPTPPWATRALVEHALRQVGHRADCRRMVALEPACGEGHMAEVLSEYFGSVYATDIHDYGYGEGIVDFLNCNPLVDIDWIITNPPFGDESEKFVLRALDLARVGVAMFVRLQWLETNGRYERIFRERPPTLISFFAERVNLCKGRWEPEGSTATAYIWLIWAKGQAPRAPFWIPPGCRESLSRPDDAARFTQHPVAKRPDDGGRTHLGRMAKS
jgi:hypothetical protein